MPAVSRPVMDTPSRRLGRQQGGDSRIALYEGRHTPCGRRLADDETIAFDAGTSHPVTAPSARLAGYGMGRVVKQRRAVERLVVANDAETAKPSSVSRPETRSAIILARGMPGGS